MRTLIRSHGTAMAWPMPPAVMPAAILARRGACSLGLSPQKKARMYSYPIARKPVYGMWRAMAGVTPAYRPPMPSFFMMLPIMPTKPCLVPTKSGWPCSCKRVFVMSIGTARRQVQESELQSCLPRRRRAQVQLAPRAARRRIRRGARGRARAAGCGRGGARMRGAARTGRALRHHRRRAGQAEFRRDCREALGLAARHGL